MSNIIYKYKIKCLTDNVDEFWYLPVDSPSPTTCPTNSSHLVDLPATTVHVISDQQVTIREEYIPTNGKWRTESFWIHGDTGPSESVLNIMWDNPISALKMYLGVEEHNRFDEVDLLVMPPNSGGGTGVIGNLTATAPTGATGLHVSSTVTNNVMTADYISLVLGGEETCMGNILSIDKVNNIIYMKKPAPKSFPFTSPTLVKLRKYIAREYALGPPGFYPLGDSKIGGTYIPAGAVAQVIYRNKGTVPKNFYNSIEYLE